MRTGGKDKGRGKLFSSLSDLARPLGDQLIVCMLPLEPAAQRTPLSNARLHRLIGADKHTNSEARDQRDNVQRFA